MERHTDDARTRPALMASTAVRHIPLTHHGSVVAYALVDVADYKWLARWKWQLNSRGYAIRSSRKGGTWLMHRQILGLHRGDPRHGDHINRDRLDCRRGNLRIAERGHKDNNQNVASRTGSTSRYRGVSWETKSQRWKACVRLDGRLHHLGRFKDEREACAAAATFRREHMPFSTDAIEWTLGRRDG